MTTAEVAFDRVADDPNRVGHHGHGHGHGHGGHGGYGGEALGRGESGPASKRVRVGYGFWLYLLSDIVMFSAFFAAYAVLRDATAGGPKASELFDLTNVGVETACLLLSSFASGVAMVAAKVRNQMWTQLALLATGLFGAVFLALELHEFSALIADGNGPTRSAFLTSFFSLVGLHGAHITAGLLWLGTMMAQIWAKGFRPNIMRRLLCFTLFWHALDIVWVAIFTVVYLMGVI